MHVIVFASTKGGVGKSSLTSCVAVEAVQEGHSVYICDLDPQQSTASWWRKRKGPDNPMLITGIETVSAAVRALKAKKAERDFLLVDTPNNFMGVIADAIEAADSIAIVTQPSPRDLEGIEAVEALIQKLARVDRSIYVVNRAVKTGLTDDMIEIVKSRSIFDPVIVRNYVDYAREDLEGKAANEVKKEAREDIAKVWERLKSIAYGERADGQTAFGLVAAQ